MVDLLANDVTKPRLFVRWFAQSLIAAELYYSWFYRAQPTAAAVAAAAGGNSRDSAIFYAD